MTSKIDPIPECDRTWEVTMTKPVDENDGEGLNRRDREADAAFISCFTKNAPSQPFFAAVTKQAEALVGLLPVR